MHIHFSICPQDMIDDDTVIEISEQVQSWITLTYGEYHLTFDTIVSKMVDP